jgi:TM2 domain-containing membrane protein YozV
MNNIVKSKNGMYVIPAVASAIIPGLGQLIKGHLPKALMFFGIWIAFGIIGFLVTRIPIIGWLIPVLLWLINVGDALFNANSNNPR